ncbi:SURF1 family protein [Blastomonas sp. AAP53]|uniref:SURF1 family protein n=1 Tax=Blastomonas sp. AAP53 TaxID=1248760 RepID=UPI0003150BEE|nr:SURF1 family protein [Blastomonas sp. AAP53]
MKRLPFWPTLIVGIAIAVMIGLGVWQVQRMAWKDALLAEYADAADRPAIAWPVVPDAASLPLYRKSSVNCLEVTGWRSASGRSARGQSGWVHIASCRTGAEGPGAQVVAGWSLRPDNPDWTGGAVSGVIAPDSAHLIRLIAAPPVAGLDAVQPPSPEDIPNNHWAYAVQWFLFAGIAAVIYVMAVARRSKS